MNTHDNALRLLVACSVAAGMTLGVGGTLLVPKNAPARTPYENCLAASNADENGYATEICESLSPGWKEGPVVNTGPMTFRNEDGSERTVPDLATDISDSCPDMLEDAEPHAALLSCVKAILEDRGENR